MASAAAAVHDELLVLYGEAHRHYHTARHLAHCLRWFDRVSAEMHDPDAVELALWFHDAVYVIGARDNERRSAGLYLERARGGASGEARMRVARLVLVTTHSSRVRHRDHGYMVDIDLSGLALPWPEYLADTRALRLESSHLDDESFFGGQRRFLRRLLDRTSIFVTPWFRDRLEATARDNITRLLDEIERKGSAALAPD